MNKVGIAVGRAVNDNLEMRAVMWLDGDPIDLGFDGSSTSQAMDISSGGAVVIATIDGEDNSYSAVLWEDGRLAELGTLGGRWAFPATINDLNVVVGNSPIFSGRTHAFRWTAEEGMTDLGVLPGCLTSTAAAINRMNEVVGSAFDCQSGEFGVLWSGGSIKDLNECVPPGGSRIVGASGINDAGQIIAWTSEARGVLLSPIDLGDIDGDGRTGVTDLLHLLAAWGRCACPADLNNDGRADHADLMLLVGNWSK